LLGTPKKLIHFCRILVLRKNCRFSIIFLDVDLARLSYIIFLIEGENKRLDTKDKWGQMRVEGVGIYSL